MFGEPGGSQDGSFKFFPIVGIEGTSNGMMDFLRLRNNHGYAAQKAKSDATSNRVVGVDDGENPLHELVHVDDLVEVASSLLADTQHAHPQKIRPEHSKIPNETFVADELIDQMNCQTITSQQFT